MPKTKNNAKSGKRAARAARSTGRDDFALAMRETLARRVAMRCSNPNCRKPTSGPRANACKAVNVGVAAHITAASRGGPRYDGSLTAAERKSAANGIWVCQNCAKLIDNDVDRYTADLLREWKRISEEAARVAVESGTVSDQVSDDVELIKFYCQCFDRGAFQDPFMQEGSMEAFDRAMEDTIIALNTGRSFTRDGRIARSEKGKAFISNAKWRAKLDAVVDMLRAVRSRYRDALSTGVIHVGRSHKGKEWYCIHDRRVADWMDATRAQLLQVFGDVCREAGVNPPPSFPRDISRYM